ncbi:Endochitinase 1 [Tolypocladium ophioglossoides CBS 100239]|uniref:Endochitinase 1 n=1 Tax=Tolypocladium ophioglossoides (strain CBS 100239) TaxID=1163406 RepID=A0A0L0MXL4_TOLOC|nr:Endochitinase 1 [Tolypocladium ophioglossoides CBS 100239]
MGDWVSDGVDVDWEYPADETEASNFVLLLRAMRDELDTYAQQHAPGYHFILSIASLARPTHYKKLHLNRYQTSSTLLISCSFNLMAYDYAGSWDTGAAETIGSELVASYSYDPSSRELISYDTLEVVRAKVSWLEETGLASSMFWEASGGGTYDKSLIRSSFTALGSLDTGLNLLTYPNSQYANNAAGMQET